MNRKAKFNLEMSIPKKIQRASNIVTSMTGNTNFTTPAPPLVDVQTAIDDLNTAYEKALDRSLSAKADQRAMNNILNMKLRQLRSYVNEIAQGDEKTVLSSGFEASKIPAPIGAMPQVEDLKGKGGDGDGSIHLDWKSVYGAKTYVIEISEDGTTFRPTAYPSGSKAKISNLEMGKFYWLRVAANGAAGLGAFSDPYKALAS